MFRELVGIADIGILTGSLSNYARNLSVSGVVMTILAVFMLVGLFDKLSGGKYGYGERFDAGFQAMGSLALAIVGIIAVSPVLLRVLSPFVTPLYQAMGASPAMFPASLLALDMGGYAMAVQMAQGDAASGNYAGIIVASMMGITLCFTVPYALTIIKKEDRAIFATGILLGVVTLPAGCILGGLAMNFTSTPMPFPILLANTLPVIILAVLVGAGLILKQSLMLEIFTAFGKCVTFIATVSPGIAIFQYLTGIRLPLFHLMVEEDPILGGVPLEVGLLLVGLIAIVLAGAFPMILFLDRKLGNLMAKFGEKTGIDSESSAGLLTQLANSIPVWSVMDGMNNRGKFLNIVFSVSGSFVFGDVLAFTGGASPEMIFPVIVAKLSGGILAILLAVLLLEKGIIKFD
ncbi:MAG: ethanolamine utilization protein EutH [Synergistaceae bacterium]|jgi:ethanolamine transporter|nr:ethanolamine utilization protein EutH [Synergistaceae bacterium]